MRQGTHESGIKVGDEQCCMLAIKRQNSHNVPPVSVYKTPGPCQQASASPLACQPGRHSAPTPSRAGRLVPLRWRVTRGDIRQPRQAAPCRYTAQRELEGIISARGFRLEIFPSMSTDVKAHLGSNVLSVMMWQYYS